MKANSLFDNSNLNGFFYQGSVSVNTTQLVTTVSSVLMATMAMLWMAHLMTVSNVPVPMLRMKMVSPVLVAVLRLREMLTALYALNVPRAGMVHDVNCVLMDTLVTPVVCMDQSFLVRSVTAMAMLIPMLLVTVTEGLASV